MASQPAFHFPLDFPFPSGLAKWQGTKLFSPLKTFSFFSIRVYSCTDLFMCVIKFFLQWILIDRVSYLFARGFVSDWRRRGLVTQLGSPYPPWDKAMAFTLRGSRARASYSLGCVKIQLILKFMHNFSNRGRISFVRVVLYRT